MVCGCCEAPESFISAHIQPAVPGALIAVDECIWIPVHVRSACEHVSRDLQEAPSSQGPPQP